MLTGRCTGDASYGDALPVHSRRAFDALLASIHRAFPGLLTATRGLRDVAIHGYVGKFETYGPVVGRQHHLPQHVRYTETNPLVAPPAQGDVRTRLVGDPPVSAAEYQHLN